MQRSPSESAVAKAEAVAVTGIVLSGVLTLKPNDDDFIANDFMLIKVHTEGSEEDDVRLF